MKRILVRAMLLVGLLAVALPLAAAQGDKRLDGLFDRLKAADNVAQAQLIELAIWQIWGESGDPAIDTLMTLGEQAMQSGNLPGAFALFDAVVQQKPDFAEGWNKRATVLFLLGALDRSAADVDKTLALEPRHFGALSGLGLINMKRERDDAALKAFEDALKIHPNLPGAKANIEIIKKRRKDKAI